MDAEVIILIAFAAYASFCRNAYLSVIVAFTVLLDKAPMVIFAREVCVCECC